MNVIKERRNVGSGEETVIHDIETVVNVQTRSVDSENSRPRDDLSPYVGGSCRMTRVVLDP